MNITLMEKAYKNKFVVYVNGFVGLVTENSIMDDVIKVLKSLNYNIKDINYLSSVNDEVPNNEADYWHEGPEKSPVHLVGYSWTHKCFNSCCFDKGNCIIVNGKQVGTKDCSPIEILRLLEKLGHPTSLFISAEPLPYKPDEVVGGCLEYLKESDEEKEMREFHEFMLLHA